MKEKGIIGYVQPDWKEQIVVPEGYTLIGVLNYKNRYYTQKVRIVCEKKGVTILEESLDN